MLLNRFHKNIKTQRLFTPSDKIIIAVSGGVDSMVLCHLMSACGYSYEVVHVNHNTRKGASDDDAAFVQSYFTDRGISVHQRTFTFEGKGNFHHKAHKARKEIFLALESDIILTAHHADDHLETILLNVFNGRSTDGIAERIGKYRRPLMPFTKAEIFEYQQAHNVAYVQDESNFENVYQRNHIRNKLLPLLKDEFDIDSKLPSLTNTIQAERNLLRQLVDNSLNFTETEYGLSLDKELLASKSPEYIALALRKFDINLSQAGDLLQAITKVGTVIETPTHQILVERKCLILKEILNEQELELNIRLEELPKIVQFHNHKLSIELVDAAEVNFENSKIDYLSIDGIINGINLRSWHKGDVFYPLGMNGKQKLKKFFVENKLNLFEKDLQPLLCNQKEIMLVVGLRVSELYKVKSTDKKVLKVSLL